MSGGPRDPASARYAVSPRIRFGDVGPARWWAGGEPAAVGADEDQLAVGVALDAPTSLVDKTMVEGTQLDEVSHVGGAAVGPVDPVMGVGPAPPLAAQEPAPAVSATHGPVEPGGNGAPRPAHAHHRAVGTMGHH